MTAFRYCESLKCESCYTEEIMAYLNAHYTEDIDFEEMGEEIGLSYSYIRRIIKNQTGQNMLDIVHHLRIDAAKKMLRQEQELQIKDVAVEVGYNNIQSFNRFFKRYEGMTPSDYKLTGRLPASASTQEKP